MNIQIARVATTEATKKKCISIFLLETFFGIFFHNFRNTFSLFCCYLRHRYLHTWFEFNLEFESNKQNKFKKKIILSILIIFYFYLKKTKLKKFFCRFDYRFGSNLHLGNSSRLFFIKFVFLLRYFCFLVLKN